MSVYSDIIVTYLDFMAYEYTHQNDHYIICIYTTYIFMCRYQPNKWGLVGPRLLTESARLLYDKGLANIDMLKTWDFLPIHWSKVMEREAKKLVADTVEQSLFLIILPLLGLLISLRQVNYSQISAI